MSPQARCGATPPRGAFQTGRLPAGGGFSWAEIEAIQHRRGRATPEIGAGAVVLYGRVSFRRQAQTGDLERQREVLRGRAQERRIVGEFSHVAAGLSDRRSVGAAPRVARLPQPEVTELWVADLDWLKRFGVGVIEQLPRAHGIQVVVTGEGEALSGSAKSDLVRDMLSVVTSCSGRLYGQGPVRARTLRACVAQGTKLW